MSQTTVAGYEVLYKAINTSAASTELVAAVENKRIRVIGFYLTSNIAQVVSLLSATTELASFRISLLTTGGLPHINLVPTNLGYTETALGAALNLTQASTNDADGFLVYCVTD